MSTSDDVKFHFDLHFYGDIIRFVQFQYVPESTTNEKIWRWDYGAATGRIRVYALSEPGGYVLPAWITVA